MKKLTIVLTSLLLCGCMNQPGPLSPTAAVAPNGGQASSGALVGSLSHWELVARNDVFTFKQGEMLSVSAPGVLRNDTWPGGVPIEFVIEAPPPGADAVGVSLEGGFVMEFLEDPGPGRLSFDYYLRTETGATSNTATVTLRVTP